MSDDPDLFGDDEGDEERAPSPFFAALGAAEERLAGGKRPGRPKGARNRKSLDFEKWYFARGFKDPAQLLAELVSSDPLALRAMMSSDTTMMDVVKLQVAAAGELMPYLHGKMPTRVEITDERLPTLMIELGTDQLAEAKQLLVNGRPALSAGAPLVEGEANEINDLEGDE